MKLSAADIEILSQMDSYQRKRRRTAWIIFGVLIGSWAVLHYLDWMSDQVLGAITGLLIFAFFTAMQAQFQLSPADKMIDLLRRYINGDAEAIRQLSITKSQDAGGAGT